MPVPITHHDLCFGCGQANVFGLHLELELDGKDAARGRFFVKQDHQGPPGFAHGGIVAAALDEAMALLVHGQGRHALTGGLEISLRAPAPVGAFVELEARVEQRDGRRSRLTATAHGADGGALLAQASAVFLDVDREPSESDRKEDRPDA